jgi:hypothetical protein
MKPRVLCDGIPQSLDLHIVRHKPLEPRGAVASSAIYFHPEPMLLHLTLAKLLSNGAFEAIRGIGEAAWYHGTPSDSFVTSA